MAFELLNVQKFIKEKDAHVVQNEKTFEFKNGSFEIVPNGLYSKQIFGFTSKEQSDKYGFIELKTLILHPLIKKNLGKIDSVFNKVLQKHNNFVIKDGMIEMVSDTDLSASAGNGLTFLIKNWSKIKLDKYKKESNSFFIEFSIFVFLAAKTTLAPSL